MTVADFPRSFVAGGHISAKGDLNEDLLVHFVRSSDGGKTWMAMNQLGSTLPLNTLALNTAIVVSSPQPGPSFNLDVGSNYWFGMRVLCLANLPNLASFHCHLIVELRNRQGTPALY